MTVFSSQSYLYAACQKSQLVSILQATIIPPVINLEVVAIKDDCAALRKPLRLHS